jgi:hypothetical protein
VSVFQLEAARRASIRVGYLPPIAIRAADPTAAVANAAR